MRLGLMARADGGGLAAMTREFHRHLAPDKTLVIDLGDRGRGPIHPGWYPGAVVNRGMDHLLTPETIAEFLDELDVVYSAETFYRDDFCLHASIAGVATVLHAMPELWRLSDVLPGLILAPTPWAIDQLPVGTEVLNVPVATDRVVFRQRTKAETFLHIAGPAMLDRDGTQLLLYALPHVRNRCRVVLRASPITLARLGQIPGRIGQVSVEIVVSGQEHYWEGYATGDVLIAPRRYGGLCLPMQEAAATGMPIVSLDLSPQNAWLPPESLIPAWVARKARMAGGTFAVHDADARKLAARIDHLIEHPAEVERLSLLSGAHAQSISWERLLPHYQTVLRRAAERAEVAA